MPTEWDYLYARLVVKNRLLSAAKVGEAMAAVRAAEKAGVETSLVRELQARKALDQKQLDKLYRALEKSLPDEVDAPALQRPPTDDDPPTTVLGTRPGTAAVTRKEMTAAAQSRGEGVPAKKVLTLIENRLTPLVSNEQALHKKPLPSMVGHYKIIGPVAEGGMAKVWKAEDTSSTGGTGNIVALKTIKGARALDASYVRRFWAEASTTVLVDDPCVIRVHEVGALAGRAYIAMEFVEGKTLRERIREKVTEETEGVGILRRVTQGLLAAHEQGITHRDIKPGNVLLSTDEQRFGLAIEGEFEFNVKLTDFGLARVFGEEDLGNIDGASFLGTAKYVAPEQARGEPPTFRTDIFALGIVAYQLFTGRDPFVCEKVTDYVWHNVHTTAPSLDRVRPGISKGLARVVGKMMAKNPGMRYDAEGLLRDLRRLESRGSIDAEIKPVSDETSAFRRLDGVKTKKKQRPATPSKPAPTGGFSGWLAGLRSRGKGKK